MNIFAPTGNDHISGEVLSGQTGQRLVDTTVATYLLFIKSQDD